VAHERFGRLPWAGLFDDATGYARDGMPITRSLADWLAQDAPILSQSREMARIYLPAGEPQREGARLRQAELARSFEELAASGSRAGFMKERWPSGSAPLSDPPDRR